MGRLQTVKRRPLLIVPFAAGVVALLLFLSQGGFGGGHGKYDPYLVILGFPGFFIAQLIPLPGWISYYDISYSVALPVLINFSLVWIGYLIVEIRRGSSSDLVSRGGRR